MLRLRNQQLYARENRIPRPSPIEKTYPLPNLPRKGLVFRFSLFVRRCATPHTPSLFAIRFSPIFSAHLRSQELVRPQCNGRSVAFWTRACSRKETEKKAVRSCPRHFSLFFNQFKFLDFVSVCRAIIFACAIGRKRATVLEIFRTLDLFRANKAD